LQQQQREMLTNLVIIDPEENNEEKEEEKQQDTSTTTPSQEAQTEASQTPFPSLVTAAPTQDPEFEIAEEIFLKGEDLRGGIDGDITIVSESFRVDYAPVWQVSPPPTKPVLVNYNILADSTSAGTFNAIKVSGNK
jgi:hypothetical protein